MKNIGYLLLFALFAFTACNDDSLSQEQEIELLQNQLSEITTIAESVSCDDPDDWTFTAIGSKACGGPNGYIAYSLTIDITAFLDKLETYRRAQARFNEKWGIISDCSIAPAPVTIACKDGKPILGYVFTQSDQ